MRALTARPSRTVLLISVLAALALPDTPRAATGVVRNAGKYGAMLSWWYTRLPPQTMFPPTVPWDASDQAWWNAMVRQAKDAGLGWLSAACWGEGLQDDPATITPLLQAIDASGGGLKIALFDDTTSEVLRKNRARGYGHVLSPRFDLADLEGRGEGGLQYFYEQQWKRFFQTVPDRYRLKVDGRPVIFMWHGGAEWYANQQYFHTLLSELRARMLQDFGVDPFVIPEESWLRLDPLTDADATYDWFDLRLATLMQYRGVRVSNVIAGYDCSSCSPPGPVVGRQDGRAYNAGLASVASRSDLVLIEGLVDVDENAHLVETTSWGRLFLELTRWFATNVP